MLATIAGLSGMIQATLSFARDEAVTEPMRPTDITALVASIVDDMADAGMPVTMEPTASAIGDCRPAALKRAITNLIDNAIKYGKIARVSLRTAPRSVDITVEDEGPGILEDELVRVFRPFYRLEGSRSRETGGIGLGLAIALSIVEAHGGQLTLANREEGGLRARMALTANSQSLSNNSRDRHRRRSDQPLFRPYSKADWQASLAIDWPYIDFTMFRKTSALATNGRCHPPARTRCRSARRAFRAVPQDN